MKICFIPGYLYQGGAQRWAVELARDAALRGHDVTLLLDFPTDEPEFYSRLPKSVRLWYVTANRWSKDSPHSSSWHLRRTPRILKFVLQNRRELLQFDIVHVVATRLLPFLFLQMRRLARVPRPYFIETYTGYFHELGAGFHRIGIPYFWAHFAAVAAAVDSPTRPQVAKLLPGVKMPIIMFGVPEPNVASVSPKQRLNYRRAAGVPDAADAVVGSVQRLHPTRRPWELIDVYATIVRDYQGNVHFIHAGDGPAREEMESRAKDRGIADRIHFLGGVADVKFPLSIIDLHIIQTWEHGIPGASGFEAAMAGIPNVGIDFTPNGYQATEEDLIWASKDLEEVGERAVALLQNAQLRAELASRQQAAARALCSTDKCGESYDRLYHAVVSERGLMPV